MISQPNKLLKGDFVKVFKEYKLMINIDKHAQIELQILYTEVMNIDRAVEIPCPTWSHFIQDKLKISIYLSLDKYKCI